MSSIINGAYEQVKKITFKRDLPELGMARSYSLNRSDNRFRGVTIEINMKLRIARIKREGKDTFYSPFEAVDTWVLEEKKG